MYRRFKKTARFSLRIYLTVLFRCLLYTEDKGNKLKKNTNAIKKSVSHLLRMLRSKNVAIRCPIQGKDIVS